jgi:hypothetical protein
MARPFGTKIIETPEELWNMFQEYLNSLEVLKMEVPHVKLGTVIIHTQEPPTMEGFKYFGSNYFEIKGKDSITLSNYIENRSNSYDDYYVIVTRIKDYIYKHNFSRAAVGIYKESLIAKQLGLSEKIIQTVFTEQPLFPDRRIPKLDVSTNNND